MCGEKMILAKLAQQRVGSPPRVRGKARISASNTGAVRITPACAGKSPLPNVMRLPIQDHPRVCGEKPGVIGVQTEPLGITPACAGKRALAECGKCLRRDHPRVCGEKVVDPPVARCGVGSPPRVRGKVQIAGYTTYKDRITPACAGKRQPGWAVSM